jgi:ADP-ribosylglycohydrolase
VGGSRKSDACVGRAAGWGNVGAVSYPVPVNPDVAAPKESRLDRMTGALLGVHAGDALGATLEFSSWPAVRWPVLPTTRSSRPSSTALRRRRRWRRAEKAVAAGIVTAVELGSVPLVNAIRHVRHGQQLRPAAMAATGPTGLADGGGGFVLDSLTLAVAAVLDPRPLPDVLVDIVRLVRDTDTNGAVAGGLLGAPGWRGHSAARLANRAAVRRRVRPQRPAAVRPPQPVARGHRPHRRRRPLRRRTNLQGINPASVRAGRPQTRRRYSPRS